MEFEISEEEYPILTDMVKFQAPPPTPIHPGILGYRPASSVGATDGRNQELQNVKARLEKPRLFQLIPASSNIPFAARNARPRRQRRITCPQPQRFDVIARRKITPWGDVLSIGCTREQQDADTSLLRGTRIHCTTTDKKRNVCLHSSPNVTSSAGLLRVLHVASRGKFLSKPQSPSFLSFYSPWINATDEWFSLPMYLASRFEVSLWQSFRRGSDTPLISWSKSIQGTIEKLNANTFQHAILAAAVKALEKDIFAEDGALGLIRDGVIWNLLDSLSWQSEDPHDQNVDTLTQVATTGLILLNSSRHKFQAALWSQVLEAIAAESEKEILCVLENESVVLPVDTTPKRKSTRKKKKRQRSRAPTSASAGDGAVELRKESDSGKNVRMPLVDPLSIEKAKEHTRKIILAGTIIDDVLYNVFDQLGLNTPPPSLDKVIEEISDTALPDESVPSSNGNKPKPPVSNILISNTHSSTNRDVQIQIESDEIFPRLPESKREPVSQPRIPTADERHRGNTFHLESDFFNAPWIFDEQSVDGWEKLKRYPNREQSLLADLFLKRDVDNNVHVASSTAASIASSSDKGSQSGDVDSATTVEKELADDDLESAPTTPIAPVFLEEAVLEAVAASRSHPVEEVPLRTLVTNERDPATFGRPNSIKEDEERGETTKQGKDDFVDDAFVDCRSPSPLAPTTPPPQLSPILVSLADLQTLRTRAALESAESPKALSYSAVTAESLPSSPMPTQTATLTSSWSRDDLRICSFTDDQRLNNRSRRYTLKKRVSAPLSYRNVAAKSLPNANASIDGGRKSSFVEFFSSDDRSGGRSAMSIPNLRISASSKNGHDSCAQSETAVDALSYEVPLNDTTRPVTRDHIEVTISTKEDSQLSSPSRGDAVSDELASLRDERNAFRDMCLTLGAEVSKLKNLLAAQNGSSTSYAGPVIGAKSSAYGPEFMPSYFSGISKATTTVGAMSDGGTHRGDHDSTFSEDGTDGLGHDSSEKPHAVHVHHMSSSATIAGSDLSVEQNIPNQAMIGASNFRSLSREVLGSISGHGMASRLTMDILKFLKAKSSALRIQDQKKTAAIERLTRLVTALWPRAQIKIYGSHVTGLCLPSSDLDFVICLPAVHKNAPALAPGALEGRNAINESSQKTLARMLKGESWIDVRSIKIIARTVVPVIKVSTKDTRAHTIQLDISFDGPEHHGLAANQMISKVMQELPMVQPLVLVLKQFLKDRSLLTAYTGGLSSYGLFLMVTRYLQEYPSSWGDCGSLLMGFLDFYGNSFDPRATGISVARRQYFARINYAQSQPRWNAGFPQHLASSSSSSVGGRPDLVRRNSFNENATMDSPQYPRPPRFQPPLHHRVPHQYKCPQEQAAYDQSIRPYTFDPLFIEDPLSEGNNVGRNAFRIFQVQRAFSDAHRALVASLEWDIHSSQDAGDGGDYPLLNCLLQSEDVFYELDDTR